jgi:hypothetical protein
MGEGREERLRKGGEERMGEGREGREERMREGREERRRAIRVGQREWVRGNEGGEDMESHTMNNTHLLSLSCTVSLASKVEEL